MLAKDISQSLHLFAIKFHHIKFNVFDLNQKLFSAFVMKHWKHDFDKLLGFGE